MKTKLLSNLTLSFAIAFFLVFLFIFSPLQTQSIDNRLKDFLFLARGDITTTGLVTIVDIDEKSLSQLGQWPWERSTFALLLDKLTEAGAGIIGLDIIFPEEDKTSPSYISKKLNLDLKNPENYDEILAKTLSNSPTIAGYIFQIETNTPGTEPPQISAIVIERGLTKTNDYLIHPQGVLTNIPLLQDHTYSSGFFNNVPDPSGIIRSVPLVMKFEDQLYPSLALEMIRIAAESSKILVDYTDAGVEQISVGDYHIPTDHFGRLNVNFRGPGKTFTYVSAIDILNGDFRPEDIAGKFILIGTSAAGLLDLRSMPLDNVFPGVEVHANVIDNILAGDFITKPGWTIFLDVILVFLIFQISYLLFVHLPAFWLGILFILEAFGLYQLYEYLLFQEGYILNLLYPTIALFSAIMGATISNYFFETRQKNLIKGKFARKVSPAVMEELLKNESTDIMQGNDREITVFFSDIRNFTNISEALSDAKILINLLNEYMDPMTEIIVKHQGTIDKFIGDAIMAYWNAPIEVEDHADKAVSASLEQIEFLKELNKRIKQDKRFKPLINMAEKNNIEPLDIGIGLNTGQAVAGEMGSAGRSDFTVIGDAINLGSRLESLCKFYNSKLNISDATKSQLKNPYIFRFLDKVTVKGKTEPVNIWQVIGFGKAEGKLEKELEKHHEAIDLYQNSDFQQALILFKELNSDPEKTNQAIYQIYIERCEHYIDYPPTSFNGVFIHTTKG